MQGRGERGLRGLHPGCCAPPPAVCTPAEAGGHGTGHECEQDHVGHLTAMDAGHSRGCPGAYSPNCLSRKLCGFSFAQKGKLGLVVSVSFL